MTWNKDELNAALLQYQQWLSGRDLSPNTVHSHGYYAGLLVRWIYGEYAPRGRYTRRDPVPATRPLSPADVDAELRGYAVYLADNGLIPGAVHTYVQGAGLFSKWLARGDSLADRPRPEPRSAEPPRVPPRPPTAVAAPGSTPGSPDGWPSESAVQSAVVGWLVSEGWSIVRVAQTSSREHGVDVVARRGGTDVLVEVKGYPSELYSAGDRAGQARVYNPATQARTYFGNALLAVMTMRDESPEADVILAMPDVQTFRGLVAKTKASLGSLRIRVVFVRKDGSVDRGEDPSG